MIVFYRGIEKHQGKQLTQSKQERLRMTNLKKNWPTFSRCLVHDVHSVYFVERHTRQTNRRLHTFCKIYLFSSSSAHQSSLSVSISCSFARVFHWIYLNSNLLTLLESIHKSLLTGQRRLSKHPFFLPKRLQPLSLILLETCDMFIAQSNCNSNLHLILIHLTLINNQK